MSDIKLPIGPFRAWLEAQLLHTTAVSLAARCAVSNRDMQRWLHEDATIGLLDVDDALTMEGSTALWELGEFVYDRHGRQVKTEATPEMEAYRYVAECGDLECPPATVLPLVVPQQQLGLDFGLGVAA